MLHTINRINHKKHTTDFAKFFNLYIHPQQFTDYTRIRNSTDHYIPEMGNNIDGIYVKIK